jgi:hypothetical protein
MTELDLTDTAIEQIARRVVELLGEFEPSPSSGRYVDAATLAAKLGVERDWVYAHADELGALRLGPNGRLRFDLPGVLEQLRADERPRSRQIRSSKYSDGPAVTRRPDRLSNTNREVTPMMKPDRHDSPSSAGRA